MRSMQSKHRRKVKLLTKWAAAVCILLCVTIIGCKEQVQRVYIDAGQYPFSIPRQMSEANVTDVSRIVLDAPAGKHGFVQSKEGHFYFEDGQRIRFWGINLVAAGNFPSKPEADIMARRLASLGFNMVRLHQLDNGYAPRGIFNASHKNTLVFDKDQLDKLDYLVSRLKQEGIYVDMNLHVTRNFKSSDGVQAADKLPENSKQVTLFDDKLIELQKQYAAELLTHYNPYTKLKYNEDPAVALVELVNENTIFKGWETGSALGIPSQEDPSPLPGFYVKELDRKWNQWLKSKYGDQESLAKAWAENEPQSGNLLSNGDFESPLAPDWKTAENWRVFASVLQSTGDTPSGQKSLKVHAFTGGKTPEQLQIKQIIKLEPGKTYTLSFSAKADRKRTISIGYLNDQAPYEGFGFQEKFEAGTVWKSYRFTLTPKATGDAAKLAFLFGGQKGTIHLDNVQLTEMPHVVLQHAESLDQMNIARTIWEERFSYSQKRVADNTEFYYDLEKTFFEDMLNYVHRDLKVKAPVSASNTYRGMPDLLAQSAGDYMNGHSYWDHPTFPRAQWDDHDFTMENHSLIQTNADTRDKYGYDTFLGEMAVNAVKGKPFVVTEWNQSYPNQYEYEAAPLLASYALLQDWDGIFFFAYAHFNNFDQREGFVDNYFDLANNPVKLSQMPLSSVLFLKGYVQQAKKTLNINFTKQFAIDDFVFNPFYQIFRINPGLPTAALLHNGIRRTFDDQTTTTTLQEIVSSKESKQLLTETSHTSDTNELTWNAGPKNREQFQVDAPKMKAAVGFIDKAPVKLNGVEVDLFEPSSFMLVPLDGEDVVNSKHMLISLVSAQHNTNEQRTRENGVSDWGGKPTLLQGVAGTVSIHSNQDASRFHAFFLKPDGSRGREIQVSVSAQGLNFSIYQAASPWIEVTQGN